MFSSLAHGINSHKCDENLSSPCKNPIFCCAIQLHGLKSILKPKSVIIACTGDKYVLSIQNIRTICCLLESAEMHWSHKSGIKEKGKLDQEEFDVSSLIFCVFVHGSAFYFLSIRISVCCGNLAQAGSQMESERKGKSGKAKLRWSGR